MWIKRLVLVAFFSVALIPGGWGPDLAGRVSTKASAMQNVSDPEDVIKRLLEGASKRPEELKRPDLPKGVRWVLHLHFDGPVMETSRRKLVVELAQAQAAGVDAIVLEIDTPGGEVAEGFTIVKAIEETRVPIVCVVDGQADSMGFYITQSCSVRVMTARSRLMTHEPSMGAEVSGHPIQWRNAFEHLKALADAMAVYESARMKISLEEFKKRIADGTDWWMGSVEAKSVGAVDCVVDRVRTVIGEMSKGQFICQ